MERDFARDILRIVAAGGVAAGLLAAAGCAGTSGGEKSAESIISAERAGVDESLADADPDEVEADLSESTEDLIAQAERDIEAWMSQDAGDGDDEADEPSTPPSPDIEWSDPHGRSEQQAEGEPDASGRDPDESAGDESPDDADTEPESDPASEALPDEEADLDPEIEEEIEQLVEDLDVDDATSRLIVRLSSELYREGAYEDQPMRHLLLIAAMSLHDPERALHVDALPSLIDDERELLATMQDMFVTLGRDLNAENDPRDVMIEALEDARAQLVQEPELHLANAAFCTEVSGFGRYETFDRNVFLSQSGQQVVIYIEVDDFTSEVNDDGQWLTRLSQQLEIYSSDDGIPVWREDWQTAVDRARNRRQDFYMVQLITIPDRLGVGQYHLKIRVRDELSGAEAETGIEFELVADERMAATEAAR